MYRILTESKNLELVKSGLRKLGIDYTLYSGDGSWKGEEERSLIIELDNIPREHAEEAARLIKRINQQEKVLLQEIPITSQFV
jgi:hypothetical protein